MFLKKLAAIGTIVMLTGCLWASITLAPTEVRSYSVGGVTTETDNTAAASTMQVDWQARTLTISYAYGSGGNSFQPGTVAPVLLRIDFASGKWRSSNGQNGTLTAPQLTSIQNTVNNWRNSAEAVAISRGIITGTQVAW